MRNNKDITNAEPRKILKKLFSSVRFSTGSKWDTFAVNQIFRSFDGDAYNMIAWKAGIVLVANED